MNVWRYFFLLLFAGSIASAAIPHSNPRAISMAGAYAGIGLGVEAPLANPANLSLPTNFNLSVALFQMAGWGYNNSYSLAHYNRYNGAYLDATAKQDILNAIPGDGMDVNGRLEVQPFALAYGPFAFSVLVQAGARGWLDKEAVSLLLFGNKVDYLYDVRPADLDAAAISTYMVSYALPLPAPTESIQHLGIGFNIKYLYGHYSAQVVNSSMHAETTYGSASADGSTLLRTAEGGNGFGLDLGMTTTFLKRWRASLVLENVAGRMAWNKKTEITTADFTMNSTNVDRILSDDLKIDDVIVSHDTTLAAPGFTATLPMTIRFGITRGFKQVYLAAELAHSLRSSALTSEQTHMAIGAEFQPGSIIRFRTGLRFGGDAPASWCGGVGLVLGLVRWDMAVQTVGGVSPRDLKGLGLATGFCVWY